MHRYHATGRSIGRVLVGAALALGFTAAAGANEFQDLIKQHAPSLVTVKYVLKMPTSDRQIEREVTGVALDEKGLILVANTRLGFNPFSDTNPTPTDIKILIGEDTEGLEAEVVIRDSELDLAWLQITEEIEKPLAHLDLSKAGEVGVGDRVMAIRLLDKYFGRKPVVSYGAIAGEIEKPRKLLVPPMHLYAEQGLPVFDIGGVVVGIMVIQVPDEEARRASGGQLSTNDIRYILSADKVLRQTKLARDEYERRKAEEAELEALGETSEKPEEAAEAEKADAPESEGADADSDGGM